MPLNPRTITNPTHAKDYETLLRVVHHSLSLRTEAVLSVQWLQNAKMHPLMSSSRMHPRGIGKSNSLQMQVLPGEVACLFDQFMIHPPDISDVRLAYNQHAKLDFGVCTAHNLKVLIKHPEICWIWIIMNGTRTLRIHSTTVCPTMIKVMCFVIWIIFFVHRYPYFCARLSWQKRHIHTEETWPLS